MNLLSWVFANRFFNNPALAYKIYDTQKPLIETWTFNMVNDLFVGFLILTA